MTADPHHANSGPGEPLYASLSASTPFAGASRRSRAPKGPQAGAEGFSPSPEPAPMVPEPCDRAEPEPGTVLPLGPWDLRGQLTDHERTHLDDIPLTSEEYL